MHFSRILMSFFLSPSIFYCIVFPPSPHFFLHITCFLSFTSHGSSLLSCGYFRVCPYIWGFGVQNCCWERICGICLSGFHLLIQYNLLKFYAFAYKCHDFSLEVNVIPLHVCTTSSISSHQLKPLGCFHSLACEWSKKAEQVCFLFTFSVFLQRLQVFIVEVFHLLG